MSVTIFMWAMLILLVYIAFIVTNHTNTGDKQAIFLAEKISDLNDEIVGLKQMLKIDSHDVYEHYDKLYERFNDFQDTINKIKIIGEANHRWIMANQNLISSS